MDAWQPSNPDVARLLDRVIAVESAFRAHTEHESQHEQQRRDRAWLLVIGLLTGIVCPVIVTGLLAIVHLQLR